MGFNISFLLFFFSVFFKTRYGSSTGPDKNRYKNKSKAPLCKTKGGSGSDYNDACKWKRKRKKLIHVYANIIIEIQPINQKELTGRAKL